MTFGIAARDWRRRAWFGLSTVLGLKARGFFIPYRYAETLPGPGGRPPYDAAETLFAACRAHFAEVLAELAPLAGDLRAIGRSPRLSNAFTRSAVKTASRRWPSRCSCLTSRECGREAAFSSGHCSKSPNVRPLVVVKPSASITS